MTIKKKTKSYAHIYQSPEGDLVSVGKDLHKKLQDTIHHNLEFDYQARNLQSVIANFKYIKKIEFKDVKNFIMSFQNYVALRHPISKKPLSRFSVEFKANLKYDMTADIFISGRKLYFDIMKEDDDELRNLKLQYFYEPYQYPLFKLPNSTSKELWSGLISKKAIESLKTNTKPEIEREHAIARSVVIPKLFTDYFEFVELKRGQFLKTLFETPNGFGTFHLVTKVENSKLKEFQDDGTLHDPLSAYAKAGIELIKLDDNNDILFNIPKVNWWVSGEARYKQWCKENGIYQKLHELSKTEQVLNRDIITNEEDIEIEEEIEEIDINAELNIDEEVKQ